MKESPNKMIKELIPFLPKSDIPFANKYFIKRDFQSLSELVDSTIYKIKKSEEDINTNDKYKDINLDALYDLQSVINNYRILIGDTDDYLYDAYTVTDNEDILDSIPDEDSLFDLWID